MATQPIELKLAQIYEANKRELDDSFFDYSQKWQAFTSTGQGTELRTRGKGAYWQKVVKAAEDEIYELLCTKNKKYAGVRKHGRTAVKHWLPIVAAFVAGAVSGITLAAATAAVAFVALTLFRLGIGTFCRLHTAAVPTKPRKTG